MLIIRFRTHTYITDTYIILDVKLCTQFFSKLESKFDLLCERLSRRQSLINYNPYLVLKVVVETKKIIIITVIE